MQTPNGYEMQTTLVKDFMLADMFGIDAVNDTFERVFNEWKDNYIYLTELVIALNWGIWRNFHKYESLARVYNELWEKADLYAQENLKGEELSFFYRVTD